MRQLRQAGEEHEHKIYEALIKKTRDWESVKFELESQLAKLQTQLHAAKDEVTAAAIDHDLQLKLEATEKENSALKLELHSQAKELKVRTLDRELTTLAAEAASKQHLESIKKAAKLEAECRKLQAAARKALLVNDNMPFAASIYVESLTDSQSDYGERFLAVENDISKMGSVELNEREPICPDSWASALNAELSQFKNEKDVSRNFSFASTDIDLMDDFLEMERLLSLAEMGKDSRGSEVTVNKDRANSNNSPPKSELEALLQNTAELEEKLQKLEGEKVGLGLVLTEKQDQLETSQSQLIEAGQKLVELQRQLASANELKQAVEVELEAANAMRNDTESQLEAVDVEVQTLRARVDSLKLEVKEEHALSEAIATRCLNLEDELSRKKNETELRQALSSNGDIKIKQEKELAVAAGKLVECQKTIASLGQQLKALATLEDFLVDSDMPELNGGSPRLKGELIKSYSNDAYFAKELESLNTVDDNGSPNGRDRGSPPSSSSTNHDTEKSRNGILKLFSQSK